ncbi:MAG TPA: type II secretion system F family protein [Baekduia sp.]|nr:type II secretion system F family protein [Baekduia sp.]
MTPAVALAAVAAALAVWSAWEVLSALEAEAAADRLRRALAPLSLAGRAGREPTPPERRRLAVLGAGVLAAGGWIVAGPLVALALATAGPALVGRLLAARRRRWRRALAAGVPAVARGLADALAGGHSVRGALELLGAAGAVGGPAQAELRSVARRLALGARTEDVLESLRRRAADPAWDTLVAAILLQRRSGGDLAALLRSIADARERAGREEREARGLTAQARATARLVAGLPFAGLALGELAAPGTLAALLGDPRSRVLLILAVLAGAAAVAVVSRLARLPGA